METTRAETYQTEKPGTNAPERICVKCGERLLEGQNFCPKCGEKCSGDAEVGVRFADKQPHSYAEPQKKRPTKVIGIGVVVLAVVVAIIAIFPKVFPSVNNYLADGNYEKAYSIATNDKKDEVIKENVIAYVAKNIPSMLKNPNSFELYDAWYDSTKQWIVLRVSGTNSYGGTVASYYYYTPERNGNDWELYCTVSDLEENTIPEVNSLDDFYDKFEIVIQNAAKSYISDVISDDSFRLGKDGIKNINYLFEEGMLDDVVLLDVALPSST